MDKFTQRIEKAFKDGDRVPGRVVPGAQCSDEYNTSYFWRKRFRDLKERVESITMSEWFLIRSEASKLIFF